MSHGQISLISSLKRAAMPFIQCRDGVELLRGALTPSCRSLLSSMLGLCLVVSLQIRCSVCAASGAGPFYAARRLVFSSHLPSHQIRSGKMPKGDDLPQFTCPVGTWRDWLHRCTIPSFAVSFKAVHRIISIKPDGDFCGFDLVRHRGLLWLRHVLEQGASTEGQSG